MAKIKLKEKNRSPGKPAMMHVDGKQVVSPKRRGNEPGDTPIAFPQGYMNRATRRGLWHRKKQARSQLADKLRESGVSHNTAGITARILLDAAPKKKGAPRG
jgi:hypothetical protein